MKFKAKTITKDQWTGFIVVIVLFSGILLYANIKGASPQQGQVPLPVYPPGPAAPAGVFSPPVQAPAPASALSPAATAKAVQEAINEAVAGVRPSIVAVTVPAAKVAGTADPSGLTFVRPNRTGPNVTGSGVIIDPAGYILTTFQTVGKAEKVKVKLYGVLQSEYMAEVVAVDSKTDLALLKIETPGVYPAAMIGNSDSIEIGDIVFAIGAPYGFSRSVSMGIVSANRRKISIKDRWYPDLIQTDAAINRGDDGGALINIRGEVIGVNMAYFIPGNHFTGIGFALPINDAANLLGRM